MSGTIAIILVFGGLIFFHELGHFIAARSMGMGVKTFSLGFGPVIFSSKPNKTRYQLALLPLGGYVALVGEESNAAIPENFTEEESFSLRPAWQRFIVIFAGSAFNILLAWFLCWALLIMVGKQEILPVVGELNPTSNARTSGLASGDIITAINGEKVVSWTDISPLVQKSNGETLLVRVERSGLSRDVTISPTLAEQTNEIGGTVSSWTLGIYPSGDKRTLHYTFLTAPKPAIADTFKMVSLTWKVLQGLVSGDVPADNIGGPIGIGKIIFDQAESGVASILFIAALISVNLGILNLLPIPVLDGGHLLFLLFEMVTRRPVPIYIREKAAIAGLLLLLSLMVFATYNDILRIFT